MSRSKPPNPPLRRVSMGWLRVQSVAAVLALVAAAGVSHGFEFHEATVEAIHLGFTNGSLTSEALVQFYLDRISHLNPLLHAIIEVNPDALLQARAADARRKTAGGRLTGALDGIPVLLKDNIATRDRLNTTVGSFALLGSVVRRDAGVVTRLRRAGAVVLGKANPTEWCHIRTVDDGWSARGGLTLNPYALSSTACGSSAGPGVAAAANMAAVTLGTETDGSILCPASYSSVVGIKPTVGLTSRYGVVPISPRQDTVGPMCRTVADAVQVLDVIVGYDVFDAAATGAASKHIPAGGYMQFLKMDGLRGKRIGVLNGFFQAYDEPQLKVFDQHITTMREHGAVVIENLDVATNSTALLADIGSNEWIAILAEFKLNMNVYLADLLSSPVRSLADVIAFNNAHPVEDQQGYR
ncbi:unnamed protein product [Alopecurus aequalis]